MKKKPFPIAKSLWLISLLVLICLTLKMVIFLDAHGSPFPFLDDWKFQNNEPFITTIFTLNNENFQAFTNALFWLAPRIGFPFWAIRYVSLALIITLILILYRQLKPNLPLWRRTLLLLSFAPFFSAYMATNLLWNNSTQTWIFFILILLAVNFGFVKPQTKINRLITFLLLLCATFTMNISLPLIFTALYATDAYLNRHTKPESELKQTFIGSVILTVILLSLYAHIRQNDTTDFSFMTLFSADYWHWLSYSLIGVWSGFLIAKDQPNFYYITGIIMTLWLAVLFCRQIKTPARRPILATMLILLGGTALVTLFRGQMMLSISGDASRHIIYAVCLIPVIYAFGAGDANKWLRRTADIWLIAVLACSLPTYNTNRQWGNFYHWHLSDVCFMEHLNPTTRQEKFTCGRFWKDLREPFAYFLKTDAAFKQYYKQDSSGAAAGFIPYHFEGKVFYKIPAKKILLFR